jgi:hypothetical protein
MNKYSWLNIILILVILLALVYAIPIKITGLAINQIYLSIKSSIKGEITAFVYESFIDLRQLEKQDIFVEFTNTGTENYTAKIEEFIYFYENNQLNETANYSDSSVMLFPGEKRAFRTIYTPLQEGFYYIKVKASYGTRRTEAWGSFYAGFIIPNMTPGPPGPGGGGEGLGGWTPSTIKYVEAQPLDLYIDYEREINMYPGQSLMTSVKVKNVGNATLHEVKFHVSASDLLEIDVNPKEFYYLDRNETVIFLLDIYADPNIQIMTYPIDFEIVTRQIKRAETISVNIVAYNITLEEEVRKTILNYEYLITELGIDILEAYLKGVDTTLAEKALDNARINLEGAKNYFELKNFEKAMEKLDEVKENLKECVFHLAQASFAIFVPAFSPIWILIIAVLIGLVFLFLLKRRKKKKKPKLLRTVEETET